MSDAVDKMTGDELNMTEANISRKMRAGDATTEEIKQYNMINGFTPAQKKKRRIRRKKRK